MLLQAGMADHRQPLDDFCRMFREVLRLEYSHKKIEFIYSECGGSGVLPGTLWSRVRDVLDDHQVSTGQRAAVGGGGRRAGLGGRGGRRGAPVAGLRQLRLYMTV